jgi:hypothetical protein
MDLPPCGIPQLKTAIPVAVVVLGCAAGGAPAPVALPAAWSAPTCLVSDTTAPTADTIHVIGARPQADEGSSSSRCNGQRGSPAASPFVVYRDVTSGSDLRDVLDAPSGPSNRRRPDVVITRDPTVVSYAEQRRDYFTTALPWSSTYIFVASHAGETFSVASASDREALARDAVTSSTRGAAEPFAWLSDSSCAKALPARSAQPHRVIAYAAGDGTARELAARIVSLAGFSRVMAMAADSIHDALVAGRVAAAVIPIARDLSTRCGTRDDARVASNAVPLVDARAHAIVRRGSGATFLVGPDGSLHFIKRPTR